VWSYPSRLQVEVRCQHHARPRTRIQKIITYLGADSRTRTIPLTSQLSSSVSGLLWVNLDITFTTKWFRFLDWALLVQLGL